MALKYSQSWAMFTYSLVTMVAVFGSNIEMSLHAAKQGPKGRYFVIKTLEMGMRKFGLSFICSSKTSQNDFLKYPWIH